MNASAIKTKDTDPRVASLIAKRWSARAFSKKPIEEEKLAIIFEATRWTASSMNEQPWTYIVARKGTPSFEKMVDCMMDGNQPWATNASVILISLARRNFNYKSRVNRHHMHDVGAANTTLLLQAAELDIYGHMIGGFHMDKTIEAFEIPEDYEIACLITLGYLDTPASLEEPFQSRELSPRPRKEVSEFVYTDHLP